jgi:hypothetical protein
VNQTLPFVNFGEDDPFEESQLFDNKGQLNNRNFMDEESKFEESI